MPRCPQCNAEADTDDNFCRERGARLYRFLVAAAFVVFAALMIISLGQRELWTDEAITGGHIADTQHFQDPFHPPGYYRLLYVWCTLLGRSDLSLRAFSVPWALLAFAVALQLAALMLRPRTRAVCLAVRALAVPAAVPADGPLLRNGDGRGAAPGAGVHPGD